MEERKVRFLDGMPLKTVIKLHEAMHKEELIGKWKEKAERLGLPTKISELKKLI